MRTALVDNNIIAEEQGTHFTEKIDITDSLHHLISESYEESGEEMFATMVTEGYIPF